MALRQKGGVGYAPLQNAQNMLSREVFARDTGQPIKLAVMKDALTKRLKGESVNYIGQRKLSKTAAMKGVPTKS